MNYFRTTLLLAFLTGLFMAVGYFIGGAQGVLAHERRQLRSLRIRFAVPLSTPKTPWFTLARPRPQRGTLGELRIPCRGFRMKELAIEMNAGRAISPPQP